MKHQTLFSLRNKVKKIKVSSAAIFVRRFKELIGVNTGIAIITQTLKFKDL